MNKRIKRKKEKQKAWSEGYGKYLDYMHKARKKPERYGLNFNHEGYRDGTAAAAIRNVEGN